MQSGFGPEAFDYENFEFPRYIIYTDHTDRNGVRMLSYMDTERQENSHNKTFAPDGTEMLPGKKYHFGGVNYTIGSLASSNEDAEPLDFPQARRSGEPVNLVAYAPSPDPRPDQIETDEGISVILHCYFDDSQPRVVVCGGNGRPIPNKQTDADGVRVEGVNSLGELPESIQQVILNKGEYPGELGSL